MPITNIAELLRCKSTTAVLRMCGAKDEEIAENASDYDYFCALCRAIPLLAGHPLGNRFFHMITSMNLSVSGDAIDPDFLWLQSILYLSDQNKEIREWDQQFQYACNKVQYSCSKQSIKAFADTSNWVQTEAENWDGWEMELKKLWNQASDRSDIFLFALPIQSDQLSVYHVNAALSTCKSSSVLSAQLLRFLCDLCRINRKTLLIQVTPHNATELLQKLQQFKKSIGLPDLIFSVETDKDLCALLPFVSQPHDASVVMGMTYDKNENLSIPLSKLAVQYPIGKLFLYQTLLNEIQVYSIKAL